MNEHKPCPLACPNEGPLGESAVAAEWCYYSKTNVRFTRISCDCGVSGPWCEKEEDAWAAWDSMPRATPPDATPEDE